MHALAHYEKCSLIFILMRLFNSPSWHFTISALGISLGADPHVDFVNPPFFEATTIRAHILYSEHTRFYISSPNSAVHK